MFETRATVRDVMNRASSCGRPPGRANRLAWVVAVAWVIVALPGHASDKPETGPAIPDFEFAEPFPALVEAASVTGMDLSGFDATSLPDEMRIGDTVSLLVSIGEARSARQWLVHLQVAELTAPESQRPPPTPRQFYSNGGTKIDFGGSRSALAIRVLGPFKRSTSTRRAGVRDFKEDQSRVLVNAEFLRLGFARACAAMLRLRESQAALENRAALTIQISLEPFPEAIAAANRPALDAMGIRPEDERAVAGIGPARAEFMRVALRTPGLDDVFLRVTDVPWWSIIWSGAKRPKIAFEELPQLRSLDPRSWGLDAAVHVHALPFLLQLNDHPATVINLAVIEPHPPFLTIAGVIGVAAQRHDGKGPLMMIRLLSARHGTAAAK